MVQLIGIKEINNMNIKQISSENIFKYIYLALLLSIIGSIIFSYFFIYDNVYLSINFDESKYDAALSKTGDIDMNKFNKVIEQIDTRNVKKNINIQDIFN